MPLDIYTIISNQKNMAVLRTNKYMQYKYRGLHNIATSLIFCVGADLYLS